MPRHLPKRIIRLARVLVDTRVLRRYDEDPTTDESQIESALGSARSFRIFSSFLLLRLQLFFHATPWSQVVP